jgi:hypothetical protein
LTFRKYKSELKILSENNFKNLNKKFSGNETVLYVLTGQTKPLEGLSFEDVEGFKHWISWSAQQLLETYDYNSFKHGLAISPKNLEVKIIGNNNLTIQKQGEALEFIAKYEREDRYIWEKEILWIPYDSRAAIIITVSNIIKNIMTVGKAISFKESYTLEKLPKKELSPEFLLKNDNDPIFKVTSVKKGLLYYKID